MKLIEFLEQLAKLAEHCPPGCDVQINGEHVDRLSLTLLNPIVERSCGNGMRQLVSHPNRPKVFDISTNGREAPIIPIEKWY
jgi:hypothetical protein